MLEFATLAVAVVGAVFGLYAVVVLLASVIAAAMRHRAR
jgi:hypothetical protein